MSLLSSHGNEQATLPFVQTDATSCVLRCSSKFIKLRFPLATGDVLEEVSAPPDCSSGALSSVVFRLQQLSQGREERSLEADHARPTRWRLSCLVRDSRF